MNTVVLSMLLLLVTGPSLSLEPYVQDHRELLRSRLTAFLASPTQQQRQPLESVAVDDLIDLLPEAMPYLHQEVSKTQGRVDLGNDFYLYQLPESYSPRSAYPMIVSLHGNPPGHVFRVHEKYWRGDAAKKGFILVSPNLDGGRWHRTGEPVIINAMRDAVTRFHVDPKRIYINGYSSGGSGSWMFGTRFADLFAGVLVRCGIRRVTDRELEQLRDHAIFVIHAVRDSKCLVGQARTAVQVLERKKIPHRYVEYPGEHDFYWQSNMEALDHLSTAQNLHSPNLSMTVHWKMESRIAGLVSGLGIDHELNLQWSDNRAIISLDNMGALEHLDLYFREDVTDFTKPVEIRLNKHSWVVTPRHTTSAFLRAWPLYPYFDSSNPKQFFAAGVRLVEKGKLLETPLEL